MALFNLKNWFNQTHLWSPAPGDPSNKQTVPSENDIRYRESDLKQLLERLAEKEVEISKKEGELKKIREDGRLLTDTLKDEIKAKEDECFQLREKLTRALERSLQEPEEGDQEQPTEEARQSGDRDIKRQLQETVELLEIRTAELRATNTFRTLEDTIPETEVIQLLQDLNFEILQASAILADAVPFDVVSNFNKSAQAEAEKIVSEFFGTRGVDLLRNMKDKEKKVDLVEIAFNACLVTWARDVVKSWGFISESSLEILDGIYNAMYSAEDQAVAGRWRALTRRNLERSVSDDQILDTISSDLIIGLASIILCTGVSTGPNEATEIVESSIRTRLNVVAAMALKLNRTIGQEMTASDLEVSLIAPDKPYDMEMMKCTDDGEALKRRKKELLVLCTTELGLTSCVKHPDRTRKVRTFLKPVVVLDGFFTGY